MFQNLVQVFPEDHHSPYPLKPHTFFKLLNWLVTYALHDSLRLGELAPCSTSGTLCASDLIN